ncbi:MAG: prepilin-type N-terminal cleavage/methylation domain-containing protein [Clostridiales bacterium]|nr:prepilin-type N-terminal cleavage/methylation domain-containing protein [Clostridiales bacterium]
MKRKNKKGFTLIEMMLSIAIIVLISGLFASLIWATKDTYYRTYNNNDSTDYAALYSQALENFILRDWQMINSLEDKKVSYCIRDADSAIVRGEGNSPTYSPIFTLEQMTNRAGDQKWRIYITDVSFTSTNNQYLLKYTIYVIDNYTNPGTLQSSYTSSMWLPMHGNTTDMFSSQTAVSISSTGQSRTFPAGASSLGDIAGISGTPTDQVIIMTAT